MLDQFIAHIFFLFLSILSSIITIQGKQFLKMRKSQMGKTEENRGIKKRPEIDQISGGETALAIWDCGSPLYDSFELVSLNHLIERHLMTLPYMNKNRVSPADDAIPAVRLVESVECRCDEKGTWSAMRMVAGFLGRKKKDERKIKNRGFGCYKF